MVTIVDYKVRQNEAGEDFYALILEGDIELVRSTETGKHYATARRTSITSTFTEEGCKKLIGKQLPGSIDKVPCEEYQYAIPGTGDAVTLTHTYDYDPEPSTEEEAVFEAEVPETV